MVKRGILLLATYAAALTPLLTTAVSERHALLRWCLWHTAAWRGECPAGGGDLQGEVGLSEAFPELDVFELGADGVGEFSGGGTVDNTVVG